MSHPTELDYSSLGAWECTHHQWTIGCAQSMASIPLLELAGLRGVRALGDELEESVRGRVQ